MRSAPSHTSPMTPPTTSTIESTAPTSWKWMASSVVPWTAASASASRTKSCDERSLTLVSRPLFSMRPRMSRRPRWWWCDSVHLHVHLGRVQPGAMDALRLKVVAPQGQLAQLRPQIVQGHPQVGERAQEHVAGGAVRTVEIGEAAHTAPRSLRLTNRPAPRTRWSRTSIPSSVPADTSRRVRARSSAEGSGSPEGWLWKRTSAAARVTASRKTSRGWTRLEVRRPTETTASCLRRRRTSRARSPKVSTGRDAYRGRRYWADSAGGERRARPPDPARRGATPARARPGPARPWPVRARAGLRAPPASAWEGREVRTAAGLRRDRAPKPPRSAAQEERQELAAGERPRPVPSEPLARPLLGRQLAQADGPDPAPSRTSAGDPETAARREDTVIATSDRSKHSMLCVLLRPFKRRGGGRR